MNITDSGRRQGIASKNDQDIVADMIINQLRWATRPLSEFWVLNLGRLNALNGPGAYLYPTYEAVQRAAHGARLLAEELGVDRDISITYPQEQAA